MLPTLETWGFGLSGPPGWVFMFPVMHLALGPQAIFVWIPATVVGVLINYQIKRLGRQMVDVAGGTPNYLTRLLKRSPLIARYAAIGYLLNWAATIPLNAMTLTDVIKANLGAIGSACPEMPLKIGLILLPFVLAFSGTRALSILHLFFVVPAIGLLLAFGLQGLSWLALSPDSPGFFPTTWGSFSFVDWSKWFFFATYATYSSETASSFVAESRHPAATLGFLDFAAWIAVPILIGNSWVISRLVVGADLKDNAFLNLAAAAQPFWGQSTSMLVVFLLSAACLLVMATAVSNCSRILYQLAADQLLAPVFAVVSRRGVFGPALVLLLALSFLFLAWGNVSQIVVYANTGWFVAFMVLHLTLWQRRGKPETLFPHLSLAIFLVEIMILGVGGSAWGWQDFLVGLGFPFSIIVADEAIRRIRFAPFRPAWWHRLYQSRSQPVIKDSLLFQVTTLIGLLCGAVLIGWWFGETLNLKASSKENSLILMVLMLVAFVGVAIAGWTSLPQVVAAIEAREIAEQAQAKLQQQKQDLQHALDDLQQAQLQLVQSEKMSALGNLVAGVAHEINNPISCIVGNVGAVQESMNDLFGLIDLYRQKFPNPGTEIEDELDTIELEYLQQDLPQLVKAMKDGSARIISISKSLRIFSRADADTRQSFQIHDGLDSTVLILRHRLKANEQRPEIKVINGYSDIPSIKCFPGQLNQVFMNILANAIDMFDEMAQSQSFAELEVNPQQITIHTAMLENQIQICIRDNGRGMTETVKAKIFDHLFTTKGVGKGTGLGLAIARQIIVEKHGGSLEVQSEVGQSTEFCIQLPICIE